MHKVPSAYSDFEGTIGKQNPLRHALETYIKVKDLWADFEEALAHLDVRAMCNDATVDIWLDVFDAYNPDAHASDFYMAAETIMGPALQIVRDLPHSFRMWVERVVRPYTRPPSTECGHQQQGSVLQLYRVH